MSDIFHDLMNKLYGHNIWNDFVPYNVGTEVQGWNGNHPSLSRLLSSNKRQIVIDVGVWKGQSTITLANSLKRHSVDGVVIAVDTFLGSPEHWNKEQHYFLRNHGFPDLYQTFLSNVAAAGLTDYVIPMPQTSTTACQVLRSSGIRPTLVHIDAAHEYREALNDIEDYWSILDSEGYLIGDDYHQSWPGIIKAAGEFSAKTGRPLAIEPPKFILQK